jgi:adenylylsulfate kinase
MIIQFCGLSGSGKSTLAESARQYFDSRQTNLEIIDGDEYRKYLCSDLGFSQKDRNTNIRRLAFVAGKLAHYRVIPIICAINPYRNIREEIISTYPDVKTVYIKCSVAELIRRDTKGMYARALLSDDDNNKIKNLSGINDPFDVPENPDLIIETDTESIEDSAKKLIQFIELHK